MLVGCVLAVLCVCGKKERDFLCTWLRVYLGTSPKRISMFPRPVSASKISTFFDHWSKVSTFVYHWSKICTVLTADPKSAHFVISALLFCKVGTGSLIRYQNQSIFLTPYLALCQISYFYWQPIKNRRLFCNTQFGFRQNKHHFFDDPC